MYYRDEDPAKDLDYITHFNLNHLMAVHDSEPCDDWDSHLAHLSERDALEQSRRHSDNLPPYSELELKAVQREVAERLAQSNEIQAIVCRYEKLWGTR
mgnify:FL=1